MLFSAKAANATSLKEVIVTANKVRCTFHLQKTAEKLAKHMGEGSSQVQAWNEKVQPDLIRCAHMFFYAYLFEVTPIAVSVFVGRNLLPVRCIGFRRERLIRSLPICVTTRRSPMCCLPAVIRW